MFPVVADHVVGYLLVGELFSGAVLLTNGGWAQAALLWATTTPALVAFRRMLRERYLQPLQVGRRGAGRHQDRTAAGRHQDRTCLWVEEVDSQTAHANSCNLARTTPYMSPELHGPYQDLFTAGLTHTCLPTPPHVSPLPPPLQHPPMSLAMSAPPAAVDPAVFLPPALREGAMGWYPESGKVWEQYGIPKYVL